MTALFTISLRVAMSAKVIYKDNEDRTVFLDDLQLAGRSTGGIMHRTRLDPITPNSESQIYSCFMTGFICFLVF